MNMHRRTLLAGLSTVPFLSACGGDSSKFQRYSGPPVTQVQVHKAQREMYLISGDKVVRDYKVALGGNPVGRKQFEGDGRTPEGLYYINRRNPNSAYHLSLGISYPNDQDRVFAESLGRKPGGDIFIHGRAGKDGGRQDWTAGCVAVTDPEIEEIYAMVNPGTPVFLMP